MQIWKELWQFQLWVKGLGRRNSPIVFPGCFCLNKLTQTIFCLIVTLFKIQLPESKWLNSLAQREQRTTGDHWGTVISTLDFRKLILEKVEWILVRQKIPSHHYIYYYYYEYYLPSSSLFSVARTLKEKIYAWDLSLAYDVRAQD